MCFLEVDGWKDLYQIHQLHHISISWRGVGDTTTQCWLTRNSTLCTLHKKETAASGEDTQKTRDSWSPGSDTQVSIISTSCCMILHNVVYCTCLWNETSFQKKLEDILAHTTQSICICGLCMQHNEQLNVQMMTQATGSLSLMKNKFFSLVLENITHWKATKCFRDKQREL